MEKINALIDKLQELKNSNAGLQNIAYHTQLLQSEILRAQLTTSSYSSTSSNIAVIMPAARATAPAASAPKVVANPAANTTAGAQPAIPVREQPAAAAVVAETPAANTTAGAHPVTPLKEQPATVVTETPLPVREVATPVSNTVTAEAPAPVHNLEVPVSNAIAAEAPVAARPAANADVVETPVVPAPVPVTERPSVLQPAAATPPPEHARYIPVAVPISPAASTPAPETPAFVTVHSQDLIPENTDPVPEPVLAEAETDVSANVLTSNRPRTIVGKNGAPSNTLFDTHAPTKEPSPGIRNELHELAGKNMASLNDRLRSSKIELGDKLGDTRVTDLRHAIGINDKFQFIQELFRGDVDMYERSIRTINEFVSFQDADLWIQRELKIKLGWQDEHGPVVRFYGLLKKRFS